MKLTRLEVSARVPGSCTMSAQVPGDRVMAKRRQSGVEDLLDFLAAAPWWGGPVLALVVYLVLAFLPPLIFTDPPTATPGSPAVVSFYAPIRQVLVGLAPWSWKILVALWAAAMVIKLVNARRLDRQTGLASIRELSWEQFEQLLAEAFRRQGYSVRCTGSASGDGGVDLELERGGNRTLVQCKQWRAWKVGVRSVRELRGVVAAERADGGVLVTSGRFTREARDFAEQSGVRLIAEEELAEMISAVQRRTTVAIKAIAPPVSQESAVASATRPSERRPDAPPACPTCGADMRQRVARRGVLAGEPFWGCSRYPKCKGKRSL
jgi:restriction system protein